MANSAPVQDQVPLELAAPVKAPLSVPVTSSGIDASCGLSGSGEFQSEVLLRVNALRAAGAVCGTTVYAAAAPLNWNNVLLQAAADHSSDMAKNNYFSHDSLDGKSMGQRLLDAGYSYIAAGENIAASDSSVQAVVARWLDSPGHCKNMMNPAYLDIGVACVHSDSSTYGNYWTMDLGRP
jgi:uncharacterized protein YkwD